MLARIILLNLLPYILFLAAGISAALIEAKIGDAYSKPFEQFLWTLYIFPFIIIGLNFSFLSYNSPIKKMVIGLGLGVVFFMLGIAMMFLFAKIRLMLGLGI